MAALAPDPRSPACLGGRSARGTPRRILLCGAAALVVVAGAACSEATTGPDTTISGVVTLMDEFGEALSQVDGVRIVLTSGTTQVTRTTSVDGRFQLPALAEGAQADLEFSRAGFGTHVLNGVPAGSRLQVALLQRSTIEVLEMTAATRLCGEPCLDLEFTATSFFIGGHGRRILRAFLGTPGNARPGGYDQTMYLVIPDTDPGVEVMGDTVHVRLESLFGFDFAGYAPGTALEVSLYGATENLGPSTEDPPMYEDLSPSHASAIIAPPG